ncbi:helix-turn-helix transcriptional regulator [Methylomonas sp. MgM2]
MAHATTSRNRQLWRIQKVQTYIPLARATLYRHVKGGLLTKPISIGGERVAWPSDEVEAIRDARIAGKTDADIKKLVAELHEARGASCH